MSPDTSSTSTLQLTTMEGENEQIGEVQVWRWLTMMPEKVNDGVFITDTTDYLNESTRIPEGILYEEQLRVYNCPLVLIWRRNYSPHAMFLVLSRRRGRIPGGVLYITPLRSAR